MKNSTAITSLIFFAFLIFSAPITCLAGTIRSQGQAPPTSSGEMKAWMVSAQTKQTIKAGQQSKNEDNLEGAIASYAKAARQTPDSADAHFALGDALAKAEQYQEALVRYTLAVTLDPNHTKALYARSQLCRRMALNAQACKDLSQLIILKPGIADYHYQRGTVLLKLKKITEAYHDFLRAYELDNKYPKPTLLWDKEQEIVATKRA